MMIFLDRRRVLSSELMSTNTRRRGIPLGALATVTATAALALAATASAGVQQRVVGGSATDVSSYPWQAALVYDPSKAGGNDAQRQLCGGVLVAPRIVLTAAHCIVNTDPDFLGGDLDPGDADIVLNETTLSTGSGEHHTLQAIYVQGGYNASLNTNDVGYLVLSSATGLAPIKLAGPTETALWTPGYPTQVSGYGDIQDGGPASNSLRVATVPIIADSTCGSPSVYGSLFFPSSQVCAGSLSGGVDSCNGDSGGPLESPAQGGIYRLIGLVSWGIGCAHPNEPGVYARLGGGSGTLHQLVVNDVAAVESLQGLPHTDIVGSGALPLGAPAAVPKKCKKKKKLNKKTGKCVKKKKHKKHRKHA
jgi:secreted trypsin-like serine protease